MRRLALLAVLALAGCGSSTSTEAETPVAADSEPRARTVADCVKEEGINAIGPASGADMTGDEAPDWEIVAGSTFIGFYDDPAHADRVVPILENNAKGFDGEVVREGQVIVVWTEAAGQERAKIEACAFER